MTDNLQHLTMRAADLLDGCRRDGDAHPERGSLVKVGYEATLDMIRGLLDLIERGYDERERVAELEAFVDMADKMVRAHSMPYNWAELVDNIRAAKLRAKEG